MPEYGRPGLGVSILEKLAPRCQISGRSAMNVAVRARTCFVHCRSVNKSTRCFEKHQQPEFRFMADPRQTVVRNHDHAPRHGSLDITLRDDVG